jgi:hypothetical protein
MPDQHLESLQARTRETMRHVGGYWRPLAAAARLLEELGELADELAKETTPDLGGELADLWIITTAMADQFVCPIADPPVRGPVVVAEVPFAELVEAGGRIARAVNYYDGPKTPRTLEGWVPLGNAVRAFHAVLSNLAASLGVDLRLEVASKLDSIPAADAGRFGSAHDPSTAASLDAFAQVRSSTPCPYADQARLWGAPQWEAAGVTANVQALVPSLTSFTTAAAHEGLDGYIVHGPNASTMERLADWLRDLLVELSAQDPAGEPVMKPPIHRRGWQFSFNGARLFVAVFSPLYPASHPRHAPTDTFVVMQTEESFSRRGVGSEHGQSVRVKRQVRKQFADAGLSYPAGPKDARIEAPLYLLPRWEGDEAVRWWTRLAD